jgi:hypothetical protein
MDNLRITVLGIFAVEEAGPQCNLNLLKGCHVACRDNREGYWRDKMWG